MNIKQVIIIRKDLNMRKGKMVSQGAHASISFLKEAAIFGTTEEMIKDLVIKEWLEGEQKKITVSVNSEKELTELYEKAKSLGLLSYLITDNGHTEFNGVKTITALSIGPCLSDEVDPLTSSLSLL